MHARRVPPVPRAAAPAGRARQPAAASAPAQNLNWEIMSAAVRERRPLLPGGSSSSKSFPRKHLCAFEARPLDCSSGPILETLPDINYRQFDHVWRGSRRAPARHATGHCLVSTLAAARRRRASRDHRRRRYCRPAAGRATAQNPPTAPPPSLLHEKSFRVVIIFYQVCLCTRCQTSKLPLPQIPPTCAAPEIAAFGKMLVSRNLVIGVCPGASDCANDSPTWQCFT